jgi:hypothetical protein
MLIVSVDPILLLFCTREWAIYTADFAGYALVRQAHAPPPPPLPCLALPLLYSSKAKSRPVILPGWEQKFKDEREREREPREP